MLVTAAWTFTGMLSTCPVIVVTWTRIGGVAAFALGSACTSVTPAMPPLMSALATTVLPESEHRIPRGQLAVRVDPQRPRLAVDDRVDVDLLQVRRRDRRRRDDPSKAVERDRHGVRGQPSDLRALADLETRVLLDGRLPQRSGDRIEDVDRPARVGSSREREAHRPVEARRLAACCAQAVADRLRRRSNFAVAQERRERGRPEHQEHPHDRERDDELEQRETAQARRRWISNHRLSG